MSQTGSPAGDGCCPRSRGGNGLAASLYARRADPVENVGGLLPGRAFPRQRIGFDGSPAEMVDAEAKELATKQLAQFEARKAAKAQFSGSPALRIPSRRCSRSLGSL